MGGAIRARDRGAARVRRRLRHRVSDEGRFAGHDRRRTIARQTGRQRPHRAQGDHPVNSWRWRRGSATFATRLERFYAGSGNDRDPRNRRRHRTPRRPGGDARPDRRLRRAGKTRVGRARIPSRAAGESRTRSTLCRGVVDDTRRYHAFTHCSRFIDAPIIIGILVVGALLFGADKLPKLARSAGQAKKEFVMGQIEADEAAAKRARRSAPAHRRRSTPIVMDNVESGDR